MKKISIVMATAIMCSPLAAQESDVEVTSEEAVAQEAVAEEAAVEEVAVEEAVAEEAVTEETEVAANDADDKDRIICRRTAVIGSKFKKRLCGTQHMWDTMANNGQRTTSEMQRRNRSIRQAN